MLDALSLSRTLSLARLQAILGFVALVMMALPESKQIAWLADLVPGWLAVPTYFAFAMALAWRRLADQLDAEQEQAP